MISLTMRDPRDHRAGPQGDGEQLPGEGRRPRRAGSEPAFLESIGGSFEPPSHSNYLTRTVFVDGKTADGLLRPPDRRRGSEPDRVLPDPGHDDRDALLHLHHGLPSARRHAVPAAGAAQPGAAAAGRRAVRERPGRLQPEEPDAGGDHLHGFRRVHPDLRVAGARSRHALGAPGGGDGPAGRRAGQARPDHRQVHRRRGHELPGRPAGHGRPGRARLPRGPRGARQHQGPGGR